MNAKRVLSHVALALLVALGIVAALSSTTAQAGGIVLPLVRR